MNILITASKGLDHPVTLIQKTKTLFTIKYGLQEIHSLSLRGAMQEFSSCVMHSAKSVCTRDDNHE